MNPEIFRKPVAYTPPTKEQQARTIKAQKASARRRIKRELARIAELTKQEAALYA